MGYFYPPGTTAPTSLGFYAQVFDTVEVNTTFHAVPRESMVLGWVKRTPDDFLFSLKMPRAVTHEARLDLDECEPMVEEFLRVARLLGTKLGPILVQLPPSFERSVPNRLALGKFMDRLPTDLRFAVELRHPSWEDAAVERALAERNVAWCIAEGIANNLAFMYPADFAYVRWNRSGKDFPNFSEILFDRSADLDEWAAALKAAPAHVRTVYGYMSDEFAGHAPASLQMLQSRLALPVAEPRAHWPQKALF